MAGVVAIILAAGRGTRFGAGAEESKLFATLHGVPLVRHVADAAIASRAARTIVVTGHAADKVAAALDGLPVALVHNDAHATGIASSIKAGIGVLPPETTGALILLADMPLVAVATLDTLIETFSRACDTPEAVIPVRAGRKGNPVVIGHRLFAAAAGLTGDEGAKNILAEPGRTIVYCPVDDPGIEIDVDTRDALRALGSGAIGD